MPLLCYLSPPHFFCKWTDDTLQAVIGEIVLKKINFEDSSLSLSCYIGGLLRTIRCESGLSGHELAKRINISQQQVSRYERGVTNFQLDMLFRFFSALEMKEHEIQYILYQIINKAADIPQYNIRRNVSTDTDISLSDY